MSKGSKVISFRANSKRLKAYETLVKYYPSLPLELGTVALEKVLDLLVMEASKNEIID